MVAESLRQLVEDIREQARETYPLFSEARHGRVGPNHINAYLTSIHYLIQHTPIHLEKAEAQARDRGLHELSEFFSAKKGEEVGHDRWAENDLNQLKTMHDISPVGVAPSMVRLVSYLNELIEADPSLYIAYSFLAEYFTVLMAPEWLNNLEQYCAIPSSVMSVIGNHAELDKDHVADALSQIDRLVDSSKLDPMRRAMLTAMDHYRNFTAEVLAHA